jgi:curved DNA-binding protein CbpA
MEKTLYDTLGVKKTASERELKKAYLKKAKETHPDVSNNKEGKEFIEAANAYKILGNPRLRLIYDTTGKEEEVDTTYTEAMLLISNVFVSLINDYKARITKVDWLDKMKGKITGELKAIKKTEEGCISALETLKELIEDISYVSSSKKRPDVLKITLAQQVLQLEQQKMSSARKKEIIEVALDILKQYKKKNPVYESSAFGFDQHSEDIPNNIATRVYGRF